MQQPTADEMYGIAKKFNRELEAFPMHTHSAIVEMVRVGMQHRNLVLQNEQNLKQQQQQERVLKVGEHRAELARMNAQRSDIARIKLVPDGPSAAPENKHPAGCAEPEEVLQ